MRLLCLDIGTKRIGLAVSDPFGWTVQPVSVLHRLDRSRDFDAIYHIIQELEIDKIIVGLPLDAEGAEGKSAKRIRQFISQLEIFLKTKEKNVPVEAWDERYSTSEAEELLLAHDVSRAKRRKVIDKMAAVMILESYLRNERGKS